MNKALTELSALANKHSLRYWTDRFLPGDRDLGVTLRSYGRSAGYWQERILSEVAYAYRLSVVHDHRYEGVLTKVASYLLERHNRDGVIGRDAVERAEQMMSAVQEDAKRYTMHCVSHAHIDMLWLWDWPETVILTLDTFRTMLNLMDEYPQFIYSQPQASVYRIVEEHAPEMLEEIRRRVTESRWEVVGSTWVEGDKNIPNGESIARQLLYARQYLSRLFGMDIDELNIDFAPDVFGHAATIPEILAKAGVRYYYHYRGLSPESGEQYLYRWQAPSGSAVTVYREPRHYQNTVDPEMVLDLPDFCEKHGIDCMMRMYGVGDHGGGPTRRDIERLIDMNTWPVFPQLRFGTLRDFFAVVERASQALPVVKGELNFVNPGCYTSQTRIKAANRFGEIALNESEAFSTMAEAKAGRAYPSGALARAWESVLFNQFHDILPGSGVCETREYAMGIHQQAMATALSQKKLAVEALAGRIDTQRYGEAEAVETVSEGAGVGFESSSSPRHTGRLRVSQVERGRGLTRIYHLFNPSHHDRTEIAELVLWNWYGDAERLTVEDHKGRPARHEVVDDTVTEAYGHMYLRVLVEAEVPAFGYSTYILRESTETSDRLKLPPDHRCTAHPLTPYVLENDLVRATFDPQSAVLISLVDKETGEEYADPDRRSAVFVRATEDTSRGGDAWQIGPYTDVTDLNVRVSMKRPSGVLRQSLEYRLRFGDSTLKVRVSLDSGKRHLVFSVHCDWHEIGRDAEGVPQLRFQMPLTRSCNRFRYDIPYGTIVREGMALDVPANSWVYAVPEDRSARRSLMLVTDRHHGFRCADNALSVSLIRSSTGPDPYPEVGIHEFSFALCLAEPGSNKALIETAYDYNHPLTSVSGRPRKGVLPLVESFSCVEGRNAVVAALKAPESGRPGTIIVRMYETEGLEGEIVLRLNSTPVKVDVVDLAERPTRSDQPPHISDNRILVQLKAHEVLTLALTF